ncbi:MAG TPA: hypothetical protein VK589_25670 [Chryseolinea sp.]|nr:hypothetical protein [Chryseolinea sp.]
MKTHAIIICLIVVTFTGCKTNSIPGIIKIDTLYRFYTREVFRDEQPGQEKTIQTNIPKKTREDLLEVQFLMLSDSLHSAIYMAMKPDLNRKHYSSYERNVLNINDINTIRFGKTRTNGRGEIDGIKFFSKDLYSSSFWEMSTAKDSLILHRIQYRWGDYDTANIRQEIEKIKIPNEFLESEINVDEALRNKVFFVPTRIDFIKQKDVVLPTPTEGGLKFKASRKYRRMKATFESTSDIHKTFWNKQIRSSPFPLMQKR